jgi:hypothetical protein
VNSSLALPGLPTKRRRRDATEIETAHYGQSTPTWKGFEGKEFVEMQKRKKPKRRSK